MKELIKKAMSGFTILSFYTGRPRKSICFNVSQPHRTSPRGDDSSPCAGQDGNRRPSANAYGTK